MTSEEIAEMNATSRGKGAVGRNAIVPKLVRKYVADEINKCKYADKSGPSILDYGAGKGSPHARQLADEGYDVVAYDIGDNFDEELGLTRALDYKYDIVYASNVLNVQLKGEFLDRVLREIHTSVRDGGVAIMNYPRSPRKGFMQKVDMNTLEDIIKEWFPTVERDGFVFYCYR